MARSSTKSRSTSNGKKKSNVIKVDFTGVESSGSVEEGRQLLTVSEVELKTSENSGNDYLNWKFKTKGGTVYHTTSLQPQTLWNLRNVLEALGMDVEESVMEIDPSDYAGLTLGAEIVFEKYNGKNKPVIVDLFKESELEESDEPDDKSDDTPEDVTFDTVMEMDKDELLELAEENDIKVPVKTKRDLGALRDLIVAELELEADKEKADNDLTYEELSEMDKDELLEVAEENDIKVPVKTKRDPEALLELIAEELGVEPAKKSSSSSKRKTGTKELTKGTKVTFEDDGEELSGKVISVNTKEGFAVLDVEGEEWEVELADIKVK